MPRAPARRRLPRAERRAQLASVARSVFAARGYEAATLEEMAERAGVTRPILYDHFGDKQGLFQVVVEAEIARIQERVAAAVAQPGDGRSRLDRGLRAFFGYVKEHPEGHAVLTRDAPVHLSSAGVPVMLQELSGLIARAVEAALAQAGASRAPAPIFAQMLIGLAIHVGRWWRQHPEVSLEEIVEPTVALLWQGFAHMGDAPAERT